MRGVCSAQVQAQTSTLNADDAQLSGRIQKHAAGGASSGAVSIATPKAFNTKGMGLRTPLNPLPAKLSPTGMILLSASLTTGEPESPGNDAAPLLTGTVMTWLTKLATPQMPPL